MIEQEEEKLQKWSRKRVCYRTAGVGKGQNVKLRQDLHLPIFLFLANKSYCVKNCLNIYRVTIYTSKYLGIVALKVLSTICFRYKSEDKSIEFLIPRVNLNTINTSFPVQVP